MVRHADVDKMLKELHESYLKGNLHDEGDLIYYRINYQLADTFGIKREEADIFHSGYHSSRPRQISQGHCENCNKVVTIIPVIYGIQASDVMKMNEAEAEGRLVIGDVNTIKQGLKVAMFACKVCRIPLPRYGTL